MYTHMCVGITGCQKFDKQIFVCIDVSATNVKHTKRINESDQQKIPLKAFP